VTLKPLDSKVERKETDFVFLREYLRRRYPQHFVPPLVFTKEKWETTSLKKKEKYFTRFLINILRNPDLRGSYFLHEFFSMDERADFDQVLSMRLKETMPSKLSEYFTLSGMANTRSHTTSWQF